MYIDDMCVCEILPIIKKGAAKLMPINSIPIYIARPNAAQVAITAEIFPINPRKGLERTASPIMQVMTLNNAISIKVELKYGTTVCVFFSSS